MPVNTRLHTLRKYVMRGQLMEIYAVNPDPNKEGRSHGYVACISGQSPFRNNVKTSYGWCLVTTPPSTRLIRRLIGP